MMNLILISTRNKLASPPQDKMYDYAKIISLLGVKLIKSNLNSTGNCGKIVIACLTTKFILTQNSIDSHVHLFSSALDEINSHLDIFLFISYALCIKFEVQLFDIRSSLILGSKDCS